MSNIGYHTRLFSDNTAKVVGGSISGNINTKAVTRLVNAHFEVRIKPSGAVVFVDKLGREVSLYLAVDAAKTKKGVELVKARSMERQLKKAEEQEMLDNLLSTLTHDEAMRRLNNPG